MLDKKKIVVIILAMLLPALSFASGQKEEAPVDDTDEVVELPELTPAEIAQESMDEAKSAMAEAEAAMADAEAIMNKAESAMKKAQKDLDDVPREGEPDRPHSMAISTSVAMVADLCGLGVNITDAGMFPLHKESLAAACGFGDFLVSDGDAALAAYSTAATTPSPLQMVDEAQAGGPLIGADIGGTLSYDFNEWLGLPLFVRTGFHYVLQLAGGSQTVVLGQGPSDMASASSPAFTAIPGGSKGATLKTAWNSSWIEVPLSVGFAWEYKDIGKMYAGAGASWFIGGFTIGIDMDAAYAAFLTSYDSTTYSGILVNEDIQETIEFQASGFAPHILLGIEAFVARDVAIFAEYWSSGYSETVKTKNPLSDDLSRVFTAATKGPDIAAEDSDYIKDITYPVSMRNTSLTFGVKYYYDTLLKTLLKKKPEVAAEETEEESLNVEE